MAQHQFQTEVSRLLHLIIHSLYSNREIFLRELVSNSSDALDKLKYLCVADDAYKAIPFDPRVDISFDKEGKTLTIADTGIGMNEADLVDSLGTIARSGTRSFLEKLAEDAKKDSNLIGQFGVGFYSAFMVSEQVELETLRRGADAQPVLWNSRGDGSYVLGAGQRDTPGTRITLHLRESAVEFLDEWRVREIVKRYSDFIAYPVRWAQDGKDVDRAVPPLNTMRALWRRARAEVKPEEYNEFYQHLTHDHAAPLKSIHVAAEGQLEFRALLFIPAQAGHDLFMPARRHGLQLYVRNVFIGADFEALLPEYLRFVRGVVDSSDLPLNVSREMLQDEAVIRKIRSNLVGRILSTLKELKESEYETYLQFYRAFGRVLKEGFHFDREQSAKLKDLVLFNSSSREPGQLVTLRAYRDAMPSTQTEIFYLCAESLEAARQSPHLEAFRQRGLDVLLLGDPIDEWMVPELGEYDGCKLRAIDRGDIELGSADEQTASRQERETADKAYRPLLDLIRARLTAEVQEVRLSARLVDSACCLVHDANDINPGMARMLRAMGQEAPVSRRLLELNPNHALLARLKARFEANRDDARLGELVDLLYDQALVAEGSLPRDPRKFAQALAGLMAELPLNPGT